MGYYEHSADKADYFKISERVNKIDTAVHFHNSMEILLVLEGEVEVSVNGIKKIIKANEACLTNNFDVHYYHKVNNNPFYGLVIMVNKSYLSSFENDLGNFLQVSDNAIEFIKKFATEYEQDSRLMRTAKILYFLALLSQTPSNFCERIEKSEVITKILTYLQENFKERITVQSVADEFGYSRGYVSTLFSAYAGERFNTYLNRLRVKSARRELEQKGADKVLDIALNNGFDSANTFYRAYKKEYGKPPVRQ